MGNIIYKKIWDFIKSPSGINEELQSANLAISKLENTINETGRLTSKLKYLLDISIYKTETSESNVPLHLLINEVNDGVFIINKNLKYTLSSSRISELIKVGDIYGKHIDEVLQEHVDRMGNKTPNLLRVLLNHSLRALKDGVENTGVCDGYVGDSIKSYKYKNIPIKNNTGETDGVMCFFDDIKA